MGTTNDVVNFEYAFPIVMVSTRTILHGSHNETPGTIVISPQTGKSSPYTPPSSLQRLIMPGLVDAHVHLNEPGWRTEWEGFETGTRAAAFGGVTTLIDMPLNAIPPTTTVENFDLKINAARGQCWVDVGFYGGVIPGNEDELVALVDKGVKGFKCFLIESGVEEFPPVSNEDIKIAMEKLKDQPTVLMFHAEMIPPLTMSVGDSVLHGDPPLAPSGALNSYSTFLDSRPPALETYAIDNIINLASAAPNLPLHIVHLSAKGVNITVETCFHYLALAAENIKDGDTRHKCCPPIRQARNQEGLWEALKAGEIATVVSDHSPCTPDLKLFSEGDFFQAWGGISTVGLGLSVLWTEGRPRGITLEDISRWTAYATAKQVGLLGQKGALEAGWDADVCIFDPEALFKVTHSEMHFKNKVTPYEDKILNGVVEETWLRGKKIYASESGFVEKAGAQGELLLGKRKDIGGIQAIPVDALPLN
ncbi:hypothetical protein BGX38DRAFT_1237980 [Terfezia claveryi]|nr:hypothetical protein BGX38DRAFT_1237980 [Terfezia claveryi]